MRMCSRVEHTAWVSSRTADAADARPETRTWHRTPSLISVCTDQVRSLAVSGMLPVKPARAIRAHETCTKHCGGQAKHVRAACKASTELRVHVDRRIEPSRYRCDWRRSWDSDLRRRRKALCLLEPIRHPVPSGENPGHQFRSRLRKSFQAAESVSRCRRRVTPPSSRRLSRSLQPRMPL